MVPSRGVSDEEPDHASRREVGSDAAERAVTQKEKALQPRRQRQMELALPAARVADTSWVTILTGQVHRGILAKIGPHATTVWLVLRSYARLQDGRVYLSLSEIQTLTGISVMTIRRAIQALEEHRMLQVVREGAGKRSRYFIVDLVAFADVAGEDVVAAREALELGEKSGEVAIRYVPSTSSKDRAQLDSWLAGGLAPTSPNVQIIGSNVQINVENLHLHLDTHDGAEIAPFIREGLARFAAAKAARDAAATDARVINVESASREGKK
jgi:DNA-binding Lrp family transcriptional regulator